MKRIFKQETVMLVSMCLVLLLVMFGATVAWFEGITPASIKNMKVESDDLVDLYVRVKTEEEDYVLLDDIGTGNDVKYSIDLDIAKQENIEDNTLAPGSYGTVKFEILSKTPRTTGYLISITPTVELVDDYENSGAGLTKDELKNLLETHLKFYAKFENGEYGEAISYSDECLFLHNTNEIKGLKGNLTVNKSEYVTLYWYWPYEYGDIPDSLNILNENSDFYEEFKKYNFTIRNENETSVIERKEIGESIELYDWDDTYIGNYIQSIKFHFDVEAIRN